LYARKIANRHAQTEEPAQTATALALKAGPELIAPHQFVTQCVPITAENAWDHKAAFALAIGLVLSAKFPCVVLLVSTAEIALPLKLALACLAGAVLAAKTQHAIHHA